MCNTTEFHLFPRLPPEIRIKIWNLALPAPRIVELRCGSDTISDKCPTGPGLVTLDSLFGHVGAGSCRSSAPLPVTLAVNRESRAETLRRYQPMFGIARRPGRVYFDPARDVLFFGRKGSGLMGPHAQYFTVCALCEGDLRRVRRIAVDEAVLGPVTRGSSEAERDLALDRAVHELVLRMVGLPALEELIFVSATARRGFDPGQAVVSEPAAEEEGQESDALTGAIILALERVSRSVSWWDHPAWNVFSRKSFP